MSDSDQLHHTDIDCARALEALETLDCLGQENLDRALYTELQEHLKNCNSCAQSAEFSSQLVKAARALPLEAAPSEMEANIMAAVLSEMKAASAMKDADELKVSGARQSSSEPKVAESAAPTGSRLGLLVASFIAFAAIMFSIDSSVWNLLSWALSLALILLLKPLIEQPIGIAGGTRAAIEAMN